MNVRTAFVSAAMCIALLAPQTLAQAQSASGAKADDVKSRLQAQDARIRELETQLQRTAQPQFFPASASNVNTDIMRRLNAIESKMKMADDASEDDWVDVSDQGWTARWGGRIMGDYVLFSEVDPALVGAIGDPQNYFEFRRVRFFVEGEGYGVYDYKLQVDFEPEFGIDNPNGDEFVDGTAIRDAYVGIHELPFFGYVRFGNYKEPFSLEELTSSKYITFMERALPVGLWAPARHVGVSSQVITPEEDFRVRYGIFFEDVDQILMERIDDNQGFDIAARATWNPVYANDGRHVVHFGAAAVFTDDRDDQIRFRTRPEVHEGLHWIDAGTMDVSDYYRFGKEAAVVWGPASVQAEAFYTKTNGILGLNDMEWWGAYAYFSYFLTGENRNYSRTSGAFGRVTPFSNFFVVPTCDGHCAGWGAWEAAVRWSWVDLEGRGVVDDARGKLHDVTFGVNWYWNPHTRMMFNAILPYGDRFDIGNNDSTILATRLQVDF